MDPSYASYLNESISLALALESSYLDDEGFEFTNSTNVSSTTPAPGVIEGQYCGSGMQELSSAYRNIHGYTSLTVCLFGCLANFLNLVILTRRAMLSPTNAILTGLALADLLNMIEYIPYAICSYIWRTPKTYGWAVFVLVHANFAQVCHTVSIWLTLTLAIWRYIAVGKPTRSVAWCTMDRAKYAIASAYIFAPLLSLIFYFSFSVIYVQTSSNGTALPEPYYLLGLSELARAHNQLLAKANFWIYSVVIKIIPCIALTVVSFRLINALMEAKRRKEKLLSKRTSGTSGGENNNESSSDRTTRMLLAVLLLFLITEFPQGILGLLSGLLGDRFFKTCYVYLGELMDFLALLNSAINFILYCAMSKKFRETFAEVFCNWHIGSGATITITTTTNRHSPSSNSRKEVVSRV